jgi:acetyltransferase-like isoleucine patch superfamily enzyme
MLLNKKNLVIGKNSKIDSTARIGIVSPRVANNKDTKLKIGDNAIIRSNTVVYCGSIIGDNLETGHNVVIREENIIGDNFKVWNNTVVDYGCKIGNNVKIHSNCYIAQYTTIEDEVFIAPGVIISNDPHPGCKFYKDCMRGPTIKKGAKIGCNVTLLPFIIIGENSLIGAGSVVTRDIPANSVAYGNPAKVYKKIWDIKCITGVTDFPYGEK